MTEIDYLRDLYTNTYLLVIGDDDTSSFKIDINKEYDKLQGKHRHINKEISENLLEWCDIMIKKIETIKSIDQATSKIYIKGWDHIKQLIRISKHRDILNDNHLEPIYWIFNYIGIDKNNRDKYSWHISSTIFELLEKLDSDSYKIKMRSTVGEALVKNMCIRVDNLKCFLIMNAVEAEQKIINQFKKDINIDIIYLFRLSQSEPTCITLTFGIQGYLFNDNKARFLNTKLVKSEGSGNFLSNYNIDISFEKHKKMCEKYISRAFPLMRNTVHKDFKLLKIKFLEPQTPYEKIGMTSYYLYEPKNLEYDKNIMSINEELLLCCICSKFAEFMHPDYNERLYCGNECYVYDDNIQ